MKEDGFLLLTNRIGFSLTIGSFISKISNFKKHLTMRERIKWR